MKVILKDTLKSKNISQYQLSKKTGITAANINNLCNGKTTSIQFSMLDKICDAIDCEISDILLHEKGGTIK
jgi:Predicted transcriptional regulator